MNTDDLIAQIAYKRKLAEDKVQAQNEAAAFLKAEKKKASQDAAERLVANVPELLYEAILARKPYFVLYHPDDKDITYTDDGTRNEPVHDSPLDAVINTLRTLKLKPSLDYNTNHSDRFSTRRGKWEMRVYV